MPPLMLTRWSYILCVIDGVGLQTMAGLPLPPHHCPGDLGLVDGQDPTTAWPPLPQSPCTYCHHYLPDLYTSHWPEVDGHTRGHLHWPLLDIHHTAAWHHSALCALQHVHCVPGGGHAPGLGLPTHIRKGIRDIGPLCPPKRTSWNADWGSRRWGYFLKVPQIMSW